MSCNCDKNKEQQKTNCCQGACDKKPRLCLPHYVVPTKFDARRFPNALVTVTEEWAVYMTDQDGFPMMTYRRVVEEDDHEPKPGSRTSTWVFDMNNATMYWYNKDGRVFKKEMEEVL